MTSTSHSASLESSSPLYSRYNGFTLGVFLGTSRLPFARRRFRTHRARIEDFLLEAGLDVSLPGTHSTFVEDFDRIQNDILARSKPRADSLRDFIGLGLMAALHGSSGSLVTDAHRAILEDRWVPILDRHGVHPGVYHQWLRRLPRQEGSLVAEDVLTPALALLTAILEPLEREPDTCFVAMPFESPFTEYYGSFYRPALAAAGLRAMRAWGGLSSEEYYRLLLTLIARSGCMLAELTTLNLNVINEVGVGYGAGLPVCLIGNRTLPNVPSNIADFPILVYSRRGRSWIPKAVEQLARFVRTMRADPGVISRNVSHPGPSPHAPTSVAGSY